MITKDIFLNVAKLQAGAGNYQVYIESAQPDGDKTIESLARAIHGSFLHGSVKLKDSFAFVACFQADQKEAAQNFADLCQQEKSKLRVIEGPSLIS